MDGSTEQGYLHLSWLQNIEACGRFLSTWLVIAPAFVVAPFVMRDRLYRMRAAQWTCRVGRGIFVPQFTAAMLSACVVLVVGVVLWLYRSPPPKSRGCWIARLWGHGLDMIARGT